MSALGKFTSSTNVSMADCALERPPMLVNGQVKHSPAINPSDCSATAELQVQNRSAIWARSTILSPSNILEATFPFPPIMGMFSGCRGSGGNRRPFAAMRMPMFVDASRIVRSA